MPTIFNKKSKNNGEKIRTKKELGLTSALITLIIMITSMLLTVAVLEKEPHIPLMIGTAVAIIITMLHGYAFSEVEEMMYKGIRHALPAIVIIILVGLVIGSWIGSGVVATMIYYGLQLIDPRYFLVVVIVLCGIVALAIGSSWSTMATVGVASMGIGLSMGISPGMVAGAVICGSYFGDKMSPLSDTTNLASGLSGVNLFEHIQHMFFTTIPALVISLVAFFFIGIRFGDKNFDTKNIDEILTTMQDSFVITPWLLIVPLAVIALVVVKVPAIPAICVGIILGFFAQLFIQGDSIVDGLTALQTGYTIESGNELVDELFNRGGLESMFYTISLTLVAMTFGGVLEYSGMLTALISVILKFAKSTGSLIASVIVSCIGTNFTCSEQYISIIVPSRMYAGAFKKKNLHAKNLSRALEDGGTLTSVFVPWNTCGVFIASTLGVSVIEYAPYAILNYTVPVISIIFGYIGFKIIGLSKEEIEQNRKEEEEANLT
ncbi:MULTISPECIES: Na+/H+ antiporter NhaC [Staphylococcus]|uniref:Sodium:proton antiporter n=1 Tax=Staphylococcus equorum TaxID=246432 RepID=A0AAP7IF41_9STAP|nr:Na+/H+ antiporter NhaC [Staphylococcus equorum]ANK38993.1 Na+/H+ antiporter [Staphylococcus sp. AntiMn-1]ANR69026.1 sodium:proton antiporter [Staphylococcus equorum]ERH36521.1 sodium:proton antiporter [Staphylococcus equorum UMC-CNS-924]KKI53395.1 Na+/H+ antiporter NhaC [Staphylococcus equorum subsp. equorum]MCE5007169.1 Na+/H+ antiporter NhaC [Staphylococcus equorum]